jgi:hypothetical protein
VCYLVVKSVDANGINLVVLAGDEHAGDADLVQQVHAQVLAPSVEQVHKQNGQEQSLVTAFVTASHFDHPVDHLATQLPCHFLIQQTQLVLALNLIKFTFLEIKCYNIYFSYSCFSISTFIVYLQILY